MRVFFLMCVLLLALASGAGAPAHSAPSAINPKLAKSYEVLAKELTDDTINPEHAATVSAELLKTDGHNAFSHYAAARLAAWHEKWDDVLSEIEAGSKAPYAIHYQRFDGPAPFLPLNATMRQLVRAVAGGATKMGPDKAVPLLKTFQTVSRKLAWGEPRNTLSYLVAAALRSIADTGFVALAPVGSPEAAAAQKVLDADRTFAKSASEDARKTFGEDFSESLILALDKQKLTVEQVEAYHKGAKVTPAARTKLLAAKKEMSEIERPWLARWLKKLPD